jgi:hypothetical protein
MGTIVAGSPGQGKSTLTAGLLSRGWSYLSDEFALIHPTTRLLEPFPKAMCIKAGSFKPVLDLGLPLDTRNVLHKGSKGPVSLIDPLAIRADAVSPPCPVRMIIFPHYEPDTEPAIEFIPRARALFELVQLSFNFTKFRGRGLELLAEVVLGSTCVRVRSGDLRATCDLLESMWDRASASSLRSEHSGSKTAEPHLAGPTQEAHPIHGTHPSQDRSEQA